MQPESLAEASRKYFRHLLTEAQSAVGKDKLNADDCQVIEDRWMRELAAPRRIVIEDDERRAPANFIDGPPQGA